MRLRGFRFSVVAVLFAVAVTLLGQALAGAVPASPPLGSTSAEHSALGKAAASGQPVVVDGTTTEFSQVVANPDGTTLTMTSSAVPVRTQQDGSWIDIDKTLSETSDGWVAPAATAVPTEFSVGGDGPLARVQSDSGEWLSVSWSLGPLPEPVINADSVTYPAVLDGVDLVLTATESGFSEVLVVNSADAAANPALAGVTMKFDSDSLSTQQQSGGGLKAVSGDGSVGVQVSAPTWWDSSQPGSDVNGPEELATPVPVPSSTTSDSVTIDAAAAASTPGVTYPVFVDPAVTAGLQAWAFVDSAYPTTPYWNGAGASDAYAHVGYVQASYSDDGKPHATRAFFQLQTAAVAGKHVLEAHLNALNVYSSSCQARPIELWTANEMTAPPTWNSQPALGALVDSQSFAYGYDASCPQNYVGWNATAPVVTAAASAADHVTLALKANDETDTFSWHKFDPNVQLVITYNSGPAAPGKPMVYPCFVACDGDNISTSSRRPTFTVTTADIDGGNLATSFEVFAADGPAGGAGTPAGSGTGAAYTTAAGQAYWQMTSDLADGTYWVRARSFDSIDYSEYGAWTKFVVDTTGPPAPVITADPTQAGTTPETRTGIVHKPVTFTITVPGQPVARVAASWSTPLPTYEQGNPPPCGDTSHPDVVVSCTTGTNGSVTVTLYDDEPLQGLYVVAFDEAGNISPTATQQVYVGRDVDAIQAGHLWVVDPANPAASIDTSSAPPVALNLNSYYGWAAQPGIVSEDPVSALTSVDKTQIASATADGIAPAAPALSFGVAILVPSQSSFSHYGQTLMALSTGTGPNSSTLRIMLSPTGQLGVDAAWRPASGPGHAQVLVNSSDPIVAGQWAYVLVNWDPSTRRVVLSVLLSLNDPIKTIVAFAPNEVAAVGNRMSLSTIGDFSTAAEPVVMYRPVVIAGFTDNSMLKQLLRGKDLADFDALA